jgi:hypothetical protein
MGKPEDRRAGPMVNGNPWPVRIFQVVDDFDGTRNRYERHGWLNFIAATRARAPSKAGFGQQAPECRGPRRPRPEPPVLSENHIRT